MQILFVLFGSRGDIVPSAALAAAARKAGHAVCMMVPREYLQLVPIADGGRLRTCSLRRIACRTASRSEGCCSRAPDASHGV